jgi:hypothetical protein
MAGPGTPSRPPSVLGVRPAVVEEVEPDQLDALVLEIDERPVEPALVRPQETPAPAHPRRPAPGIPGRPVHGPVDPRATAGLGGTGTAPATRTLLVDLAEEPADRVLGDRTEAAPHGPDAGLEVAWRVPAAAHDQARRQDQPAGAAPHRCGPRARVRSRPPVARTRIGIQ